MNSRKGRRPSAEEIAGRLHGSDGRLFVCGADGVWRDTETDASGSLGELAAKWCERCTETQQAEHGRKVLR